MADRAEISLLLIEDHDRIAQSLNDTVVRRLFAAGLDLHTALGLIGDHPGAGKIHKAIAELDLAIRDIRDAISAPGTPTADHRDHDHQRPSAPALAVLPARPGRSSE